MSRKKYSSFFLKLEEIFNCYYLNINSIKLFYISYNLPQLKSGQKHI